MPLAPGTRLGIYEVHSLIGSGGMGQVYRAADPRLHRAVAIKLLPSTVASDPRLRERFEREAKAVASLNHPNIVTIHSVEEFDGQPFITMELVEGQTLAQMFGRQGLPTGKLLEVAVPLADAVAAAHQRGITHRDLKPANVMVTHDGRVKVLDFGLAKPSDSSAPDAGEGTTAGDDLTSHGTVVGTAAYMSPEQAEGKPVDYRSDIFSLGVVLYEMATGVRPFRGDSSLSLLSSIIRDKPRPVNEVNRNAPHDLARIIRKCLEKDVDDRYQSAKDLRNDLRDLKRDLDSGELEASAVAAQRSGARASNRAPWVMGAALIAVAAVALGWRLRHPAGGVRLTDATPLTSAIGLQDFPSWAADGKAIVYVSNESGNLDIWVKPIGTGPAVNRTADSPQTDNYPRWSPDGQSIAFYSNRDGGGYFVMSALGGPARLVRKLPGPGAGRRPGPPAWSADSSRLAYVTFPEGVSGLEVLVLATGATQAIALPRNKAVTRHDPAWASDAGLFAYVEMRDVSAQVGRVWVLNERTGKVVSVTDGKSNVASPLWSPRADVLYYVSNRSGSMELWEQPISGEGLPVGNPVALTTGGQIRSAALSPDGKRFTYSRGHNVSNLWRVPILSDRAATWADATQLTFDEANVEFVDVSADGKRLLVSSDRSGNPDIWSLPTDNGEFVQITTDPTPEWRADYSPDGSQIAYYGYRSGNRDIWVMPAVGGASRQITSNGAENAFSGWSPDGKSVVFYSDISGSSQAWVTPVTGGSPRQVTTHAGVVYHPAWSPDGKTIVFAAVDDGTTALWRVPAAGGTESRLTRSFGLMPRWSPDGRRVFFTSISAQTGVNNIWAVDIKTGAEHPLTDFRDRRGRLSATVLATDGRVMYFGWGEFTGQIWVVRVAGR